MNLGIIANHEVACLVIVGFLAHGRILANEAIFEPVHSADGCVFQK
jgi:hypothetical protein